MNLEHIPEPSCLDAAYERKAIEDGCEFDPVFPENKLFKMKRDLTFALKQLTLENNIQGKSSIKGDFGLEMPTEVSEGVTLYKPFNSHTHYRIDCMNDGTEKKLVEFFAKGGNTEKNNNLDVATDKQPQKDYGKHYKFSFKGVKLDPYRIFQVYSITHPAQQHALKKLLRAGNSVKSLEQDIDEVIMTLNRWKEMLGEEK